MRYVWAGFVFLIIASFITPVLGDTIVTGDTIVPIPLTRPCFPTTNGIVIHAQTHVDGSRVEVVCDGGQYRMKYIKRDGTTVFVGKCPFARGRNEVYKKLTATIVTNQSGTFLTNETVNKTFWISFDAPPVSFGPPTTNGDRIWVFDPVRNNVTRQETKHEGQWINVTDPVTRRNVTMYVPNGSTVRPNGNATTIPAPSSPGLLSLIPDTFDETGVGMSGTPIEYVYTTPVPVTGIENGKRITIVLTMPIDSEIPEIQTVEAEEGRLFAFDINFPGENAGLVTYTLIEAPEGMTLGETDGILSWTPQAGQAGDHTVTVSINYPGLTPDVDTFILPVKKASEPSPLPTTSAPTAAPTRVPAFEVILAISAVLVAILVRRR